MVDADIRAGKCTGVEVQGSGGGLADIDPAFGPRTGDGAQGQGSGQAGTVPTQVRILGSRRLCRAEREQTSVEGQEQNN